jgi:putative ABC transport system permease protein
MRRNILVLLSIMIGSSGLICLSSYINRWEYTLVYDTIFIHGKGSLAIFKKDGLQMSAYDPKIYTFNEAEQGLIEKSIHKLPGVEDTGRFLLSTGLISNGCMSAPFEILGYEPELDQRIRERPEVKQWCDRLVGPRSGKPFSAFSTDRVVGLALGMAKVIGKSKTLVDAPPIQPVTDLAAYCEASGAKGRIANDPNVQLVSLTMDGQLGAIDADIAHLFSTGFSMMEDTKISAPLKAVQNLVESNVISYFSVYLKNHSTAAELAPFLESELRKSGLAVDVYPWDDERLNPYYVGTMNFLYTMGYFFGFLILAVVALSVVNLSMMNAMDRSRELGSLKAMGFRQKSILSIFFYENALLGVLGCALGLMLSKVTIESINAAKIEFVPPGASEAALLILVPDFYACSLIIALVFVLVVGSSMLTCHNMTKKSCNELLTAI